MTAADAAHPPTDLAALIREIRAQRRLSLSALAVHARVAKSTLSRWEAGIALPRLPELDAVLDALNASDALRRRALEALGAPRAVARLRQDEFHDDARADVGAAPAAGDLLRAMRLRVGLAADEVAGALGVSARSVRAWERSDAWPTADHLHGICHLLGAAPAEVAALTAGGAWLTSHVPLPESLSRDSLDEMQAYLRNLAFGWDGRDMASEPLKDLAHLSALARLVPLAARYAPARLLLIGEDAFYAHWLCNRHRYGEAARYADRALALAHAERFPEVEWLRAALIAARCAVYGRQGRVTVRRAREGVKRLDAVLPLTLERSPEFAAWALSEMAEYRFLSGETAAALTLGERAVDIAARCENAYEMAHRRFSLARLLLDAARPQEALAWLPRANLLDVSLTASEQLLHAEALLALGSVSEAHDWLGRAYETVREYKLDPHEADALAQKF